jgi:NTE family protein
LAAPGRPPFKTALVLAGGGARGAYEVGVLSYLEELASSVGRRLPVEIICGTSVGAVHACYMAATADQTRERVAGLENFWRSFTLESVLDIGFRDFLSFARSIFRARPSEAKASRTPQLGLVRPLWLEQALVRNIPWRSIKKNLDAGHFDALSVTATHVATGHPVVFVQQRDAAPAWNSESGPISIAARLGPKHALASASIPLLFPAISIGKRLYVDGGLRLSVPLSPALRLGAQRVIVVSVKRAERIRAMDAVDHEPAYATAPFLLGKTLNALFLDPTSADVARLQQVNELLEAGIRAHGPTFIQGLNQNLPGAGQGQGQPLRYVREMSVKPSQDIGALAAEYARSPRFGSRNLGMAGRFLRQLAERESEYEADLVSYLLFEGEFASQLIELGRDAARAARDRWLRFWSDEPLSEVEAQQMELDRSQ